MFNDPKMIKFTSHVDCNFETLGYVRFINLNSYPAKVEHATANFFVNQIIYELKLERNIKNNDFNKYSLSTCHIYI